MRAIQRQLVNETFWRKKILPVELKRLYDPSFVWEGSFRWFQSANVVRLEDYRDSAEMARIRMNILKPAKVRAQYWAA
jgi:hypothetical protein